MAPILSQTILIHATLSSLSKIHLNVIQSLTSWPPSSFFSSGLNLVRSIRVLYTILYYVDSSGILRKLLQ